MAKIMAQITLRCVLDIQCQPLAVVQVQGRVLGDCGASQCTGDTDAGSGQAQREQCALRSVDNEFAQPMLVFPVRAPVFVRGHVGIDRL